MELLGLQSAAHLNGRTAHVIGLDEASGRLAVELELARKGEAHSMKVKETNLKPLPPLPRTAAALQDLVDRAEDGGRVSIPRGRFMAAPDGAGTSLQIKSAITLQGQGPNDSVLLFPVAVQRGASGAVLQLAKFCVEDASLTLDGTGIGRARLSHVHIDIDRERGDGEPGGDDDALILNRIGREHTDAILVEDCEVLGGADGVTIEGDGVRLLRCRILGAASRGIFANPSFVIEGCVVQGHGGYGMQTRSGCERRGRNNIQPEPWDETWAPWHQGHAPASTMGAALEAVMGSQVRGGP